MAHPKKKHLVVAIAALALCGLLAGCDRTPDAGNKEASSSAQVDSSPPAPAHADSEASAANTPSVEEAQAFIVSRLTQQSASPGSSWMPSNVLLNVQRWTWSELQVTTVAPLGIGTTKSEQYEVDPRALSVPVRVEGKTVTFECALSKCIDVQISVRTMTTSDEESTETNSQEQRASNKWYFSSEQEAERVAAAMNLALTRYGARARVF